LKSVSPMGCSIASSWESLDGESRAIYNEWTKSLSRGRGMHKPGAGAYLARGEYFSLRETQRNCAFVPCPCRALHQIRPYVRGTYSMGQSIVCKGTDESVKEVIVFLSAWDSEWKMLIRRENERFLRHFAYLAYFHKISSVWSHLGKVHYFRWFSVKVRHFNSSARSKTWKRQPSSFLRHKAYVSVEGKIVLGLNCQAEWHNGRAEWWQNMAKYGRSLSDDVKYFDQNFNF
jgi:hypothetical protein